MKIFVSVLYFDMRFTHFYGISSSFSRSARNSGPIGSINDDFCKISSKYDMLGFAANGRISGPPVFRSFTPLEAVFRAWDPSQMKDLAETLLFALFSSNFD